MIRQMDVKHSSLEQASMPLQRWLPFLILFMMVGSLFLLDAVTSLQYLGLHTALLKNLGSWPFFPAHTLFPNLEVAHYFMDKKPPTPLLLERAWKETALLVGTFVVLFVGYLLALRYLPRMITFRYILLSTILLGILCVFFAAVLSNDVFSYINYARMAVIYHLNPLVAVPTRIRNDISFPYVYWTNQPSIYGPTWIVITAAVQRLLLKFGFTGLVSMVLSLRLIGLAMHLGSVALIWAITGTLQKRYSFVSTRKRVLATLAFAWNPLLLVEAVVNAHVDAAVLFLLLLAIWFLLYSVESRHTVWSLVPVAALFAFAICLKLNVGILVTGLLLFLWFQRDRIRKILLFTVVTVGVTVLLYAPFWQHGALIKTIQGTPATAHNMNTLADFASNLYKGIGLLFVHHPAGISPVRLYVNSHVELYTHTVSMAIFALFFIGLCWWTLRVPERINNVPALIRWLAFVWLLYCAIGSPWFWPWYLVTFLGLFALVEATTDCQNWYVGLFRMPLVVRLLAFSSLTLYCFFTWGVGNTLVPGLFYFHWSDFRGLYMWIVPLLGLRIALRRHGVGTAITHKLPATRWHHVRALLGKVSNSTTAS